MSGGGCDRGMPTASSLGVSSRILPELTAVTSLTGGFEPAGATGQLEASVHLGRKKPLDHCRITHPDSKV